MVTVVEFVGEDLCSSWRARWRHRQTATSTSPAATVATTARAGASDPTIVSTGTTAAAVSSSTVSRRTRAR
ncbi:hypothetical protein [Amycolatopsis sp. cmx-4-68]|uniref:hypothetical protein n=1 Tax=Amycolatopsis sp. cmx-4-68 TaxID=2790938 RepID=UPI00397CF976